MEAWLNNLALNFQDHSIQSKTKVLKLSPPAKVRQMNSFII